MTLTNYLLNAYIDANILLIFAFGVWALARFILGRFGFSQAFGLQLKLLNGVFLAVAVSILAPARLNRHRNIQPQPNRNHPPQQKKRNT